MLPKKMRREQRASYRHFRVYDCTRMSQMGHSLRNFSPSWPPFVRCCPEAGTVQQYCSMCGRFTRMYTWRELVALYRLTDPAPPSNLQPRYNICPTTTIDVVIERDGKRVLEQMRWGLVPNWWNKPLKEMRLATLNVRAETVAEKPFFRSAFKHTRCLIPASGYYEWKTIGKEKQPFYFTRRDGQIITIAGLWSEWTNPETGKPQNTCTMIITAANAFVAKVHDRMPVILEEKQFDEWLDDGIVPTSLVKMLKPAGERVLACRPVSKRVNSSRADGDDATLIEKVGL